jgi:hypothetical protein
MAKDKKSFVLYVDQRHVIDMLTDEQAGQVLKQIFSYVADEHPETDDPVIKIAFEPIKQQLRRDLKKYEGIKEKRSAAGKASAEKRKQQSSGPKKEEAKPSKEVISTNSTLVEDAEQDSTLSTVNDNDNDNVNDNVNDNDILLKDCTFNDESLKESHLNRIAFNFWRLFKKNLKEAGIHKSKNLENAKLAEWANIARLMIEKDERTLEQIKEVRKFLEVNDFWKKNIRSMKKLRIQFEQLIMNAKNSGHGNQQNSSGGARTTTSARQDFDS